MQTPTPPYETAVYEAFRQVPPQERTRVFSSLLARCSEAELMSVYGLLIPYLTRDFVGLLPQELALHVLSFIDARSLVATSMVCTKWRAIVDNSYLWKRLCAQHKVHNTFFRIVRAPIFTPQVYKNVLMRKMMVENHWANGQFKLTTMYGHYYQNNVITCLQADENVIVCGSDDWTLMIWDANTCQLVHTLRGHTGGVWSCQFVGNVLVSGSTDRTLRVWDMTTGLCRRVLEGHISTVRCHQMERGICVSGSRDTTIKVWDINEGTLLCTLSGHQHSVRCIQFDGNTIVSGSYDHTVKVWDLRTRSLVHTLRGHTQKVYSLALQGDTIVSGSLDTQIMVWDARSGSCTMILAGHRSLVGLMQLRGDILVSGNADYTLKVWNIRSGVCLHTLEGHKNAVTSVQFDDDRIVSSSDDGTVKVWDVHTGKMVRELLRLKDADGEGSTSNVAWRLQFSHSRIIVAVKGGNGLMGRWKEPAPSSRLFGMPRLLKLDFDVPFDELPGPGEVGVAEMTMSDADVPADAFNQMAPGALDHVMDTDANV